MRGLASTHTILGAIQTSCSVSALLEEYKNSWILWEMTSGVVSFQRFPGSSVDTVHASVFVAFGYIFFRDCGPRILRSTLGPFHEFCRRRPQQSLVRCLGRLRSTGICMVWDTGMFPYTARCLVEVTTVFVFALLGIGTTTLVV